MYSQETLELSQFQFDQLVHMAKDSSLIHIVTGLDNMLEMDELVNRDLLQAYSWYVLKEEGIVTLPVPFSAYTITALGEILFMDGDNRMVN